MIGDTNFNYTESHKTTQAERQTWKQRKCGVLLPIFSLPNRYGIGTVGHTAQKYIEYLASAGVRVWQILPLLPTSYGDSPYQSVCSYALNYYFIDLQILQREELFIESELADYAKANGYAEENSRIDYEKLFHTRVPLLKSAFLRFNSEEYKSSHKEEANRFADFVERGEYYDFALFMSLKTYFSFRPWQEWGEYATYSEEKTAQFAAEHAAELAFWQFTQYEFLKQWNSLHAFAKEKGVAILGDMPIYVASDSVEMWKYGKQLFETDENGRQTEKAGVPPDAFSADGQLWGNPVYRWNEMKQNGYAWWKQRIQKAFELFDIVRIDHFRGFDRYFSVPAEAQTARAGEWKDGPKAELFENMKNLPIVAEDLGVIDEGVLRLMENVGYPGMRVLEFAFDGSADNTNKPSNSPENSITYTGTHDNLPFAAYVASLADWEKERFSHDFRRECEKFGIISEAQTAEEYAAEAVRLAFAAPSFLSVAPLVDLLSLGEEARINAPSTLSEKNWSFRFSTEQLFSPEVKTMLLQLEEEYKR